MGSGTTASVLLATFMVLGWSTACLLVCRFTVGRLGRRGRRGQLNRALHELRRPLQILMLRLESGGGAGVGVSAGPQSAALRSDLELIRLALSDLDRVVNGGDGDGAGSGAAAIRVTSGEPDHVPACELVAGIKQRWTPLLARDGRPFKVRTDGDTRVVSADPCRVAQALDGLIANAREHGCGAVSLSASARAGRLRLSLANGVGRPREGSEAGRAGAGDPRHGHGLDLATEIVQELGGSLLLAPGARRYEAVVSLPLRSEGAAEARPGSRPGPGLLNGEAA